MKRTVFCLFTLLFFFGLMTHISAQITVVGHITAEVVNALAASETSQISFGQFSTDTTGGQIIMTPDGTRSTTGDVKAIGGTHYAGTIDVKGDPGAILSIQLPSFPAILTNPSNSGTMSVTSWVSDPPQQGSVTIPASGKQAINVGATLVVGSVHHNPIGIYNGTYSITFSYN